VPSNVPFGGQAGAVVVVVVAGITVTVRVAPVATQPVVVPVTVYVVVELGETVIEALVAPVFHEYELDPLAVSVVDCPWLIVTLAGEIETAVQLCLYPLHSLILAGFEELGLTVLF
jgi:citrate lyase gamma subunit